MESNDLTGPTFRSVNRPASTTRPAPLTND